MRNLAKMLLAGIIAETQCCTVASVRKRLQASGIERGRSSAQEYMKVEHWPAKQVKSGQGLGPPAKACVAAKGGFF